ncbi:MAG: hypothetical protein WCF99_18635 [Chloroflexales bacterium]
MLPQSAAPPVQAEPDTYTQLNGVNAVTLAIRKQTGSYTTLPSAQRHLDGDLDRCALPDDQPVDGHHQKRHVQ